jgi:ribosomal protein S18 acetylase RimI-like enzyme
MAGNYTIRNMSKDEVKNIAIEWAAKEGWNPGLYDLESFYATDPNGFYLGLLDNEPISCISTVAYDDTFGFLGFYIVKKEFRGNGYGLRLWNEALKHLPTQNIGLDGVVDQQENYKKSGFKLAYRNIRHEGKSHKFDKVSKEILPVNEVSFDKLVNYDSKLFPVTREIFLKDWITQPESRTVVFTNNQDIEGYGMIRKCKAGYKIGPLFADNEQIAVEIFKALNNFLNIDTTFYLDTPELNEAAVKLAKDNDMKYVFETARMYTKDQPKIELEKIFGVTTFELG